MVVGSPGNPRLDAKIGKLPGILGLEHLHKVSPRVGIGRYIIGEIARGKITQVGSVKFPDQAFPGSFREQGFPAFPEAGQDGRQLPHRGLKLGRNRRGRARRDRPPGAIQQGKQSEDDIVDMHQSERGGWIMDRAWLAPRCQVAEGGHYGVVVGLAPFSENPR